MIFRLFFAFAFKQFPETQYHSVKLLNIFNKKLKEIGKTNSYKKVI
ncbi:uncharacterized protein METZ01_LOCUS237719 [marine metagenome]|uniref:Uncharacterized protein n=1 Tax=marine metagenome TaxID=408172 RepID=A0A382HCQ5_9ZZZZ